MDENKGEIMNIYVYELMRPYSGGLIFVKAESKEAADLKISDRYRIDIEYVATLNEFVNDIKESDKDTIGYYYVE